MIVGSIFILLKPTNLAIGTVSMLICNSCIMYPSDLPDMYTQASMRAIRPESVGVHSVGKVTL